MKKSSMFSVLNSYAKHNVFKSQTFLLLCLTSRSHTYWISRLVTNYNGPLEAVHCSIHSVRYDMVLD